MLRRLSGRCAMQQDPGKLAEGCTVSFHLLFRIFEDYAGYFSGLKQMTRMDMHMTIQIVARLII